MQGHAGRRRRSSTHSLGQRWRFRRAAQRANWDPSCPPPRRPAWWRRLCARPGVGRSSTPRCCRWPHSLCCCSPRVRRSLWAGPGTQGAREAGIELEPRTFTCLLRSHRQGMALCRMLVWPFWVEGWVGVGRTVRLRHHLSGGTTNNNNTNTAAAAATTAAAAATAFLLKSCCCAGCHMQAMGLVYRKQAMGLARAGTLQSVLTPSLPVKTQATGRSSRSGPAAWRLCERASRWEQLQLRLRLQLPGLCWGGPEPPSWPWLPSIEKGRITAGCRMNACSGAVLCPLDLT